MDELRNAIVNLLERVNGKLYGDDFIGYRIQESNGIYRDNELGEIYEMFNCRDDCTLFNEICASLKSGDHNW